MWRLELKQRRFWAAGVNRKFMFLLLARFHARPMSYKALILAFTTWILNEKGEIRIKEEKSRLPVEVRGSKTSVLKLPKCLSVVAINLKSLEIRLFYRKLDSRKRGNSAVKCIYSTDIILNTATIRGKLDWNWLEFYGERNTGLRAVIIKISISLSVIGLKDSYFPLIHLSSCYRTVCYRTVQ